MSLAPVIAVVGPSGVGKDSVMEALETRAPGIQRLRRVITRPEGEEGEDFDETYETNGTTERQMRNQFDAWVKFMTYDASAQEAAE